MCSLLRTFNTRLTLSEHHINHHTMLSSTFRARRSSCSGLVFSFVNQLKKTYAVEMYVLESIENYDATIKLIVKIECMHGARGMRGG